MQDCLWVASARLLRGSIDPPLPVWTLVQFTCQGEKEQPHPNAKPTIAVKIPQH